MKKITILLLIIILSIFMGCNDLSPGFTPSEGEGEGEAEATGERVVLVELFNTEGCPASKVANPIAEQLAEEYGTDKVILVEEAGWGVYSTTESTERFSWYVPGEKHTPFIAIDGLNETLGSVGSTGGGGGSAPSPTPEPAPTKGSTVGTIMVPEGSKSRDLSGWVPLPNATVTLTDSTGKTHTVTTDENGNYTFYQVAPGSNYIITATGEVAGNTIVLKDIVPQLKAGEEYDAGIADAESKALALIVEEFLEKDIEPDIGEIEQSAAYLDLVSQVTINIETFQDVTTDDEVNNYIFSALDETAELWDGWFSGEEWHVDNSGDGTVGPGPNYFTNSINNVWKDKQGNLHLKIVKRDGDWYCVGISNKNKGRGYGEYIFSIKETKVNGKAIGMNELDENVVIGLFTYDNSKEGSPYYDPGNREIDIEFAKWGGDSIKNNTQLVVYEDSADPNSSNWIRDFLTLSTTSLENSTNSIFWKPNSIEFEVCGETKIYPDDFNINGSHNYTPNPGMETACLNLWLYKQSPKQSYVESVELIIDSFNFTKYSTPNENCILNVPYRTTTIHNGCLCAAGAMVFSYYGIDLSQEYFADMVIESDSFLNILFGADDFGHPQKMVDFAKSFGFSAELSLGLTIDEIKLKLKEGVPVIVLQYSDTDRDFPEGLHYRVIIGFDDETQSFMASCSQKENYLISYTSFLGLNVIPGNLDICPSIIIESDGLRGWVDVDPKSGEAPHEVSFTGFICGGVIPYTYQWDFGDGNWSQKGVGNQYLNIHHIYEQSDIYSPILHVEDGNGDKKQFKTAEVTVTEGGSDAVIEASSITGNSGDHSIEVRWPIYEGASDYKVYRSTNGVSDGIIFDSNGTIPDFYDNTIDWWINQGVDFGFCTDGVNISLIDLTVTEGNSYSYYVVAYGGDLQEEISSNETMTINTWLPACWLVAPVDGSIVTDSHPLLEWSPPGISIFPYGQIAEGAMHLQVGDLTTNEEVWDVDFYDLTTSSIIYNGESLIPGHSYIWRWYPLGLDQDGHFIAEAIGGARQFIYMEPPEIIEPPVHLIKIVRETEIPSDKSKDRDIFYRNRNQSDNKTAIKYLDDNSVLMRGDTIYYLIGPSWEAYPEAEGYRIYRKINDANYELMKDYDVSDPVYNDAVAFGYRENINPEIRDTFSYFIIAYSNSESWETVASIPLEKTIDNETFLPPIYLNQPQDYEQVDDPNILFQWNHIGNIFPYGDLVEGRTWLYIFNADTLSTLWAPLYSDNFTTSQVTYNGNSLITGNTYRWYVYRSGYGTNDPVIAVSKSEVWEFTYTGTSVESPTVITVKADNITQTSAKLYGNITDTGGENADQRGFAIHDLTEGIVLSPILEDGSFSAGEYNLTVSGLTPGRLYQFAAYAKNSHGSDSGEWIEFTADNINPPTVSNRSAINITQTSATIRGRIDDNGGEDADMYRWSYREKGGDTYNIPSDIGNYPVGDYALNMNDYLSPGRTYEFTFNAKNSAGWSNNVSWEEFDTLPSPKLLDYITVSPSNMILVWPESLQGDFDYHVTAHYTDGTDTVIFTINCDISSSNTDAVYVSGDRIIANCKYASSAEITIEYTEGSRTRSTTMDITVEQVPGSICARIVNSSGNLVSGTNFGYVLFRKVSSSWEYVDEVGGQESRYVFVSLSAGTYKIDFYDYSTPLGTKENIYLSSSSDTEVATLVQ